MSDHVRLLNAEVEMSPDADLPSKGFYRHWKGGTYFVHGLAVADADGSLHVVYESVEGVDEGRMRTRTVDDFMWRPNPDFDLSEPGDNCDDVPQQVPRFERMTK